MEQNNKDIKNLLVLLIAVITSFLVAIAINLASVVKLPEMEIPDTVWRYRVDTLYEDVIWHDTVPNVIDNYITKTDTVYTKDGSEIALNWEKRTYADTLTSDGDTVSYKAYLAGIDPVLDSISIKTSHKTIVNTEIAYIQPPKQKKKLKDYLYYGVGVSAGYDPFNRKPAMIVGAQAGIRL